MPRMISNRENGLEPDVIRGFMKIMQVSQVEIAHELNVTKAAITRVINRDSASRRIETIIAEKLGLPYSFVWGSTREAA